MRVPLIVTVAPVVGDQGDIWWWHVRNGPMPGPTGEAATMSEAFDAAMAHAATFVVAEDARS